MRFCWLVNISFQFLFLILLDLWERLFVKFNYGSDSLGCEYVKLPDFVIKIFVKMIIFS
jgi:hypothetical protein